MRSGLRQRLTRAGALAAAGALVAHLASLAIACGHGAFGHGAPHWVATAFHGADDEPAGDCARACAEANPLAVKPDAAWPWNASGDARVPVGAAAPRRVVPQAASSSSSARVVPSGPPIRLRYMRLTL